MSSTGSRDYWDQIPEQDPRATAHQREKVHTIHTCGGLPGAFTPVSICAETRTCCRECASMTVHMESREGGPGRVRGAPEEE